MRTYCRQVQSGGCGERNVGRMAAPCDCRRFPMEWVKGATGDRTPAVLCALLKLVFNAISQKRAKSRRFL